MPLTGNTNRDISELMHKVDRKGTFGNMPRGMSRERLHRAAIAASLEAKRRKGKRKRHRHSRERR